MSYLSKICFNTGSQEEPYLDISLTTTLGYTGFRGKVFTQEGTCMFFDLGHEEYHMFWMSQVPFPLDVIFIGADFKVVDIVKGEPNDETPFTSIDKAAYVVETTYGWSKANGIVPGVYVEFKDMWS
jgi:uncharacterized membrane protein (UPF0127 family)